MKKIEERLARNLGLLTASQNVAMFPLDPAQVQMIVELINQLVSAFKACKTTPEETVSRAKNPTSADKRQVKSVVRQELGFFRNLFQGRRYVEAVLKTGRETTVDEVREALGS